MNAAALAFALCCTDFPIQDSDFDLFPFDETVQRQFHDATHYREILQVELEQERTDKAFWREWIAVSWHSCRAWKYLHLATTSETWNKETTNHCYLGMLRDEIGMEAYYSGIMPPTRPYAPRLWAPFVR